MAVNNTSRLEAYSIGQPTVNIPAAVIVTDRNPTANDKAPLGQIWVNPSTNTAFILVSVVNNQATWGIYATPIVGNLVVAGTVTAGLGFIATAGGIQATGNSSITGDFTVSGNITSTNGDITATNGNLYAPNIATTTNAAKGVSMWENYVYSIGTDPNVDLIMVPQGDGAFVLDGLWGGTLLSQWRTRQTSVQTTDATKTVLFSIPLGDSEMVLLKAYVNGFKSTYDHALSAEVMISAFRPSGGNVTQIGAKVITGYIDDTATAGVSVDADVNIGVQALRLYVTGANAETWNWVTTASYMYTTHP